MKFAGNRERLKNIRPDSILPGPRCEEPHDLLVVELLVEGICLRNEGAFSRFFRAMISQQVQLVSSVGTIAPFNACRSDCAYLALMATQCVLITSCQVMEYWYFHFSTFWAFS